MEVIVTVNGRSLRCTAGLTVAAAMLQHECGALRETSVRGEARSMFCGMGLCHDCGLIVDGRSNVLACSTLVRDGMTVETQRGDATLPELGA